METSLSEFYFQNGDEIQKLYRIPIIPDNKLEPNPDYVELSNLIGNSISCSFEIIGETAKKLISLMAVLSCDIARLCPNNRVKHLALHARKKRARKKNMHRILKMLEKEIEHD